MYKNITVLFPVYYREHPEVVENLLHACANIYGIRGCESDVQVVLGNSFWISCKSKL
jgi:hypothetical protein